MINNRQKDDWVFVTPIYNLELTKDINQEIKILRVTFISSEKLRFSHKRLNLASRGEFKKLPEFIKFLTEYKTFAVVRTKGSSHDKVANCGKLVEKELNILLSSILSFKRRKRGTGVQIQSKKYWDNQSYLFLENGEVKGNLKIFKLYDSTPLRLDRKWKKFQNDYYFNKLLKILNSKNKIQPGWRNSLERAAIMIGQSQNSSDLSYCFLLNMIVIEMLLTESIDKYSEKLPERVEAFLGWVGFWRDEDYAMKIKELYKKRSEFVHEGIKDNIHAEDLLFSDDLVFNLMNNIINHLKIFGSKKDLISYSNKFQCEKVLGIKSKIQPKTLKALRGIYTQNDYDSVEHKIPNF